MSVITISIVCDGTSDLCIHDLIQWITDTSFPEQAFRISEAREVIPAHGPLHSRLKKAYSSYEPHIIVCHRDAESMSIEKRITEIIAAHTHAEIPIPVVPAVPVRMIESWLLTNAHAIRCAADNKNGTVELNLPRNRDIEQLPDPKSVLFTALKTATNLAPRRLKQFDAHRARRRIASFMEDFDSLKRLPSFQKFEKQLITAIASQIN
ncbi:hypothetical protein [Acidovorax sp. 106]|uniref:hypothetical protein n=1 Tax=Acidovorax sp. 106 TaxID=2135637 RepID=UPI0011C3C2C3|nr:hypothetical protein [Acidovorax sp. 106]